MMGCRVQLYHGWRKVRREEPELGIIKHHGQQCMGIGRQQSITMHAWLGAHHVERMPQKVLDALLVVS